MKNIGAISPFQPQPPDAAGVISWVHLGDLHMTKASEQNHLDLTAIVNEVNRAFAGSVSFVFLPGDVADDGSRAAYAVVRGELDCLNVPWCAIIGDHDVHEKSFANFLDAMSYRTHYSFTVGSVRFVAMNAFDVAHPASFSVSAEQLSWVRQQLQAAADTGQDSVLLLHCYPTDLKVGRRELIELLGNFEVRLIDMGHTHYNEISNDGKILYFATRSTGQIEEGHVGYSVINIDHDVISWRFLELGDLPLVIITSPVDERLQTKANDTADGSLKIRAKSWGEAEAVTATATLDGRVVPMKIVKNSQVWEVSVPAPDDGKYRLLVSIMDANGKVATDEICVAIGQITKRPRAELDQDNAIGAWPAHGLLGSQLGPNKNGKKW